MISLFEYTLLLDSNNKDLDLIGDQANDTSDGYGQTNTTATGPSSVTSINLDYEHRVQTQLFSQGQDGECVFYGVPEDFDKYGRESM
jgi:hypothetical protein